MRISDWSSDVCSSDLSLRGRLRHSRAKIGRARKCKTDEQDHSDNSDDYVRHNTPIKKGRESSTPALLKTRHSSPTALDASVDAVAVRGVAEATRREIGRAHV